MLIVPEKKALIFKLKNPSRITAVIPTAKIVRAKEGIYVAVPHRLEETLVLRNLGFNAPAPIKYYYNWPSSLIKPFTAQVEAAEFLSMHRRAFNTSELGTGKSLASLWAYDFLRKEGAVNKALIVSPLSTLERTWADEIFRHFPHLECAVLHGTATKRVKLLEQDVDIYIINHDGVEIVADALAKRPDIDLVMVDELAQVGRNASTDRWKALNVVVNKQHPRMCWGMTGTPTPNGPLDAWAQCKLLVPERVPPYFNRWRDNTMRQTSRFTWMPREGAMDLVKDAMQPAIRFTREECIDLPPLMYETRQIEMTSQQNKAYREMLATMRAEAENGEILAVNEAVKMSKLVQIACGVAYSPTGEEVSIPATNRIAAVLDILQEAAGKVIVFVPFVSTVASVSDALRTAGYTVEVIHGGVSKPERDRIFTAFQRADEPKVLVAQPAAMSHGLTLTAASTIVWFAPITSNETFQQANGRIQRPGQKLNTFIIMLEGSPIERKIYGRLQNKQKLQGLLLDEIKASRREMSH